MPRTKLIKDAVPFLGHISSRSAQQSLNSLQEGSQKHDLVSPAQNDTSSSLLQQVV